MSIKLAEEVINVIVNLICLFHVDEVPNSFHYNYFLQKWYIFLEPAILDIFLNTRHMINQVLITHNELNWYFDFTTNPWCREFPVSVIKINRENRQDLSCNPDNRDIKN